MRVLLSFFTCLLFLYSCKNSAIKTGEIQADKSVVISKPDTTGVAALVGQSELMKSSIEATAPAMIKQEVFFKNSEASESVKQEWMKMNIYKDSSGAIRRVKLYPYTGVSERSEEYYFDNEKLFFVYISDHGISTENKDEGKPGKEFHFVQDRLVKYDDYSGDKELDIEQERKMYQASLPVQAKGYMAIARAR